MLGQDSCRANSLGNQPATAPLDQEAVSREIAQDVRDVLLGRRLATGGALNGGEFVRELLGGQTRHVGHGVQEPGPLLPTRSLEP